MSSIPWRLGNSYNNADKSIAALGAIERADSHRAKKSSACVTVNYTRQENLNIVSHVHAVIVFKAFDYWIGDFLRIQIPSLPYHFRSLSLAFFLKLITLDSRRWDNNYKITSALVNENLLVWKNRLSIVKRSQKNFDQSFAAKSNDHVQDCTVRSTGNCGPFQSLIWNFDVGLVSSDLQNFWHRGNVRLRCSSLHY